MQIFNPHNERTLVNKPLVIGSNLAAVILSSALDDKNTDDKNTWGDETFGLKASHQLCYAQLLGIDI